VKKRNGKHLSPHYEERDWVTKEEKGKRTSFLTDMKEMEERGLLPTRGRHLQIKGKQSIKKDGHNKKKKDLP